MCKKEEEMWQISLRSRVNQWVVLRTNMVDISYAFNTEI